MITGSSPSNSFAAVVPHRNDGARVGRSLASLAAQTVPFDEIVVVDDASTDGSLALVEALVARMPNARLVRLAKNLGVVGALNAGIAATRAEYVFLASANDHYAPRAVEWASAWSGAPLICGNGVIDGAEVKVQLPQRRGRHSPDEVLASARSLTLGFVGGSCFLSRPALEWAGGLVPALRWNSDWFVYCLLALARGCAVIPDVISWADRGPGSYSSGGDRWPEQREVTLALLDLLATRFPETLPRFREAAVLPRHGLRELMLIAGTPGLRHYLTPLLAWRCLEDTRVALVPAPVRRLGRSIRARVAG